MSLWKKMLWPFFQGKPEPAKNPPKPPVRTPAATGPGVPLDKTGGSSGPRGDAGARAGAATGPPTMQPPTAPWATGPMGNVVMRDIPGVTRPPRTAEFAPPPFQPLVSNDDRRKVYGSFHYRDDPQPGNPEHIRITDNWERENIVWVPIPQLRGIPGAEVRQGRIGMEFHRKGVTQLATMWRDWEDAGLLHHILSFDGSFVSRYVRGSRTNLSNHCFGNAFDINYEWNKLGQMPAAIGARGSVRELLPIASFNGFFWGGFYHGRLDGMHFELARVDA